MAVAGMLTARAYLRSAAAVCCSFTAGDFACQQIERSAAADWSRTGQFALVGGAVLGPASHTLETMLERWSPGPSGRSIARKVAARVLVSPIFLSLNFGALALLRRQDVAQALQERVWPAWQTGCLFWPGVAALTYKFVPLPLRPGLGAAVGCCWSCYLSWVAHRQTGGPEAEHQSRLTDRR